MKKEYEVPEAETVLFYSEDVITTSTQTQTQTGGSDTEDEDIF